MLQKCTISIYHEKINSRVFHFCSVCNLFIRLLKEEKLSN